MLQQNFQELMQNCIQDFSFFIIEWLCNNDWVMTVVILFLQSKYFYFVIFTYVKIKDSLLNI